MKIVVIGGTGLIGSKVVDKLNGRGHDAVAASPASGVESPSSSSPLIRMPAPSPCSWPSGTLRRSSGAP